MNNQASASLREETPAPVKATDFHQPNADGIYENVDVILVPMTPGNVCHFLLARTDGGFIGGFKFFIRSPRDHVEQLPRLGDIALEERNSVLFGLLNVARKFFDGHKTLQDRLTAWANEHGFAEPIGEKINRAVASSDVTEEAVPVPVSPAVVPLAAVAGAVPTIVSSYFASVPVREVEVVHNARKKRSPERQAELTDSIREQGELIQPIAVHDRGEGVFPRYGLICGEGRWLGVKKLGWDNIDAKVYVGITPQAARIKALIENLQREDLNPIDEAEEFAELITGGLTQAELAQQTGKDQRTIQKALSLVKLPEEIRELVRAGKLSARQARELVGWVSAKSGPSGFVARPQVAIALAEVAVEHGISSDELAQGIPPEAISVLLGRRLIAEIPERYRGQEPATLLPFAVAGRLFTFDLAGWKTAKKALDKDAREAAKKAATKASTKVGNGVSVSVTELKKGKVNVVELHGDDEIYAEFLPKGSCAPAVADNQAEVMVCLQPDLLQQLKVAERDVLKADRVEKLAKLRGVAKEKIRKMKRISGREFALILEAAMIDVPFMLPPVTLDGAAFKLLGIRPPKDLGRESLAKMEPLQAVRVFMVSLVLSAEGQPLEDHALRWILEMPKLGLIEEDKKARREMLSQLSAHLFPTDDDLPMEDTPAIAAKPKKARK